MIARIGAGLTKLEKFCNVLASISIMGMMLLVSVDTLMRYFFKKPINGVTEVVSCYLSIILVYLSISYCYRRGGHVRVTIIENHLPPAVLRVIDGITGLASTGFFLLVAITNIGSMKDAYIAKSVPGGVVETPIWPGYLILVVGAFLIAFRVLLNTILVMMGRREFNITPGYGE